MRIPKPILIAALDLVVLFAASCAAEVAASTLPLIFYANDISIEGLDQSAVGG